MPNVVFAGEPMIRMSCTLGILVLMVLWEVLAPRRSQEIGRWQRWPSNLGIVVVDTALVRVVFPAAAVGMAMLAQRRGWGLFNVLPVLGWAVPGWAAVPASVILLDLVIYAQHRVFHAVPWLWRLHRMHHADLEIDVTTGVRFHPIEIGLSLGIKIAAVIVLGAPPIGVLIFEVLLNATSMFNHGNVRLPGPIDRVLRRMVVTPEMHRVHHSILRYETDSNFGFNLPWWDHLFGTYRAQPEAGHERMTIGIDRFRDSGELRLDRMLFQPLRNDGPAPRSTGPEARPA